MAYTIKYIAQVCDKASGKIVKEEEIFEKAGKFPKAIDQFGLRHADQIALIKNAQDFFLALQCELIANISECPNCGRALRKQGTFISDFHDVFTDHKVKIQRLSCQCGWRNQFTVAGLYGNASHPELINLQVENGAKSSYEKASEKLNRLSCLPRTINNSRTIINHVNKVGEILDVFKKGSITKWFAMSYRVF